MPAILKIGYDYYLCKSKAQAIAALKALSDAVLMDHGYERKIGDVYYPDKRDRASRGIELKIVQHNQLRRAKPGEEADEAREVKLLDFNGPIHYAKESGK